MPELLADLTTLRLGGPARELVVARDAQALIGAVRAADAAGASVLLVGGGSNLVVGDAGWPGTVVVVRSRGLLAVAGPRADSVLVTLQAGEPWDDVVAHTVAQGWSGLATMSGIPGLSGATPIQNVGAYGAEIAEVLREITVLDRGTGAVETWDHDRCDFGFRTSAFKHTDRYVLIDVTLELTRSTQTAPVRYVELAHRLGVEPGDSADSARVRDVVLELRASKGMLLDPEDHDTWSVGSFFVNPFVPAGSVPDGCPHWEVDGQLKLSAAWLIENAGFGKGYGLRRGAGRVAVSTKHSLALTNRGGATTAELLQLAAEIRAGVEERYGVRLRPEARLAGASF